MRPSQVEGGDSTAGGSDLLEDEHLEVLHALERRVVADEAGCSRDYRGRDLDHIRHGLAMNRPESCRGLRDTPIDVRGVSTSLS